MIKVLDHGYVWNIEYWGCDENIIAAARMSTNKGFLGWGTPEEPGDEKLLRYLWINRHTSPFEQAGATFEVQAPIMVFREWHRHRTLSVNEFSARYSKMPNLHYVPERERIKLNLGKLDKNIQAQGIVDEFATDIDIDRWLDGLECFQQAIYEHYERGLKLGIPKEIARLNTPVSRYSKMRVSANLLNWLRFLGLRQASNAQWEIREYADVICDELSKQFPRTLQLFKEKPL